MQRHCPIAAGAALPPDVSDDVGHHERFAQVADVYRTSKQRFVQRGSKPRPRKTHGCARSRSRRGSSRWIATCPNVDKSAARQARSPSIPCFWSTRTGRDHRVQPASRRCSWYAVVDAVSSLEDDRRRWRARPPSIWRLTLISAVAETDAIRSRRNQRWARAKILPLSSDLSISSSSGRVDDRKEQVPVRAWGRKRWMHQEAGCRRRKRLRWSSGRAGAQPAAAAGCAGARRRNEALQASRAVSAMDGEMAPASMSSEVTTSVIREPVN